MANPTIAAMQDMAKAHLKATSQILQIYPESANWDDVHLNYFPSNIEVVWSCNPIGVLEYLEKGATVRFLANDMMTTCLFPPFPIPNDHRGPFAGFRYANAGVLEIDMSMTSNNEKRWYAIPLSPFKTFEMLNYLYAHGWNPATGKLSEKNSLLHSMPLIAPAEGPIVPGHYNLTYLIDSAIKQGITDISNLDLQVLFPQHIKSYYSSFGLENYHQTIHITLETDPKMENLNLNGNDNCLSTVTIKARAGRNGWFGFDGEMSDAEFTRDFLLTMGLPKKHIDRAKLLDREYIVEYYEDIDQFGYNL